MAVIPVYQGRVGISSTLGVPRQSASAAAGAFQPSAAVKGVVQLAATAADVMGKVQQKQQQERDKSASNEAFKKYSEWATDYLHSTDSGVLKRELEHSEGITKSAREDYDKSKGQFSKNLNVRATRAFNDLADRRYLNDQTVIARHESQQLKQRNANSQADVVKKNVDWMSDNAPSLTAPEIEDIIESTVKPELAEFAQYSPKTLAELEEGVIGTLYSDTIQQAIASGATERAKALLERWDENINPKVRNQLTANIRNKELNATAEDNAFGYYTQLRDEQLTTSQINDEINDIQDNDLKRLTRSRFDAYNRQFKNDQAVWVNQETASTVADMDNMAGSLVDQQRYVDEYPSDTESQRKVKKQLTSRLTRYKSAEGLRPTTDATSYGDASEKIASGEITAPEQIDENYITIIEKSDREKLKKDLTASQVATKRQLKVVYTQSKGIEGGVEARLTVSKKKDFGEFLMWSEAALKESNRAQDPKYIQELADMWVMEGEVKRRLTPGFGKDTKFGKAVREGAVDKWLPDEPESKTTDQIKALFRQHAEIRKAWLAAYDNDEELAIRGYYKKLLAQELGPEE